MALFMGFMIVLSGLFVSTLDVQSEATITSKVDQDAWYLLRKLQYDLYQADQIIVPATNGGTSSSLTLDIAGETVTYNLVSGSIDVTDASGSYSLLSDGVEMTSLSFTRLGNDGGSATIRIQYELRDISDVTQSRQIQTAVGIR